MRYTVVDVAREAGVSVATVDRVLNNRAGVRERTRGLVFESARRLLAMSARRSRAKPATSRPCGWISTRAGDDFFMQALSDEIETQARARPGLQAHVARIADAHPDALAAGLIAYRGRTQGLGVVAPDHPAVREALRTLALSGVAVATMVSDVPFAPRLAFIGVDNRAAGRLAGYILRPFRRRPSGRREVAMFAGSLSYRALKEREMGFRHLLAEEAANLGVVALREMRDDVARAYAEASSLPTPDPPAGGDLQHRRRQCRHRTGAQGAGARAPIGVRRARDFR